MQHGYRVGDPLLVQRRGAYYFARAARESFPANVVAVGPDGEADFDGAGALPKCNHYWAKEIDGDVTYSGDNNWNPAAGGIDFSVRSQTDPTSSGGLAGRWIDAVNVSEPDAFHELPVDGTQDVVVHVFKDPTSQNPFYVFSAAERRGTYGTPKDVSYANEHQEASRSTATTWDRTSQGGNDGYKRSVVVGEAYYDTSDETWYEYRCDDTYDSKGALAVVTAEYRVTVEAPVSCGQVIALTTKTASYTVDSGATPDEGIIGNAAGDITITLPAAATMTNRVLLIKNINTGTVTVDANGAETIDGDATQTLDQYDNIMLFCNGAAWFVR